MADERQHQSGQAGQSAHSGPFKCNECHQTFQSETELREHEKAHRKTQAVGAGAGREGSGSQEHGGSHSGQGGHDQGGPSHEGRRGEGTSSGSGSGAGQDRKHDKG